MGVGAMVVVGWKVRVGLVLSAAWLCLVFLVADEYQRLGQTLAFGAMPLIVIWGIAWAVAGWRTQRAIRAQPTEATRATAREKRRARIRTALALIAVLSIGLFAATWQFKMANNEAGGHAVGRWFGEWSVYGLITYAILRAFPKLPYGAPSVLALLLVVGAVNYKAHALIDQDRRALESLAKSAPLINKILSGVAVTDQEVIGARVGVLEPLMLAQATYGRDVVTIAADYEKTVSGLGAEQILTPASLASAGLRVQTRAKLTVSQQAIAQYKARLEAATARGRLGIQAAAKQVEGVGGHATRGFDEASAQLTAFVNDLEKIETDISSNITELLDFLDSPASGYVLEKGPPPNLLFRDERALAQYRHLYTAILEGGKREQALQARFLQAQAGRTQKVSDLLKN